MWPKSNQQKGKFEKKYNQPNQRMHACSPVLKSKEHIERHLNAVKGANTCNNNSSTQLNSTQLSLDPN
jgi:hypothetical protein